MISDQSGLNAKITFTFSCSGSIDAGKVEEALSFLFSDTSETLTRKQHDRCGRLIRN